MLGALLGLGRAVSSSDRLGQLVRDHAGFADLADAAVETHLVATNLLTGHPVLLSDGPVDAAVRASAAVPGLYPPVLIDGQHLVDGGVAHHSSISDAVTLGATTIWVLPTGYPCALPRPPRTAVGVALQALTLLIEEQLIIEVATHAPEVTVKVLPPLCPLAVSAADFSPRRAAHRPSPPGHRPVACRRRPRAAGPGTLPRAAPPPEPGPATEAGHSTHRAHTTAQSDDQHSGAHPT